MLCILEVIKCSRWWSNPIKPKWILEIFDHAQSYLTSLLWLWRHEVFLQGKKMHIQNQKNKLKNYVPTYSDQIQRATDHTFEININSRDKLDDKIEKKIFQRIKYSLYRNLQSFRQWKETFLATCTFIKIHFVGKCWKDKRLKDKSCIQDTEDWHVTFIWVVTVLNC